MKKGAERGQGGSMLRGAGVVLRSYEHKIGYGSEYLFLNQKSAAN